jgi:hypothetical protein
LAESGKKSKYFRVETHSKLLPYVIRDHAWNHEEHDNTNWAAYKNDTPDGYQSHLTYDLPHPSDKPYMEEHSPLVDVYVKNHGLELKPEDPPANVTDNSTTNADNSTLATTNSTSQPSASANSSASQTSPAANASAQAQANPSSNSTSSSNA